MALGITNGSKNCDMRGLGVPEPLVAFLFSCLASRRGKIVVQGSDSDVFAIANQVFQGTVLGPPLWAVFFKSVDIPIATCEFESVKFADDLTVHRSFASDTPDIVVKEKLRSVQECVHSWGKRNRAVFDAAKEHYCVIHRTLHNGDTFRLSGTLIDPKLTMADEIDRIPKQTKAKCKAILGRRTYYDIHSMIQQFKTHVLCILEGSNGAIYHAALSNLQILDNIQDGFIRELSVSRSVAFLRYNMAPLQLRRDIGILGLLHEVQLGQAQFAFNEIFPAADYSCLKSTRHNVRRHNKQFAEFHGCTDYLIIPFLLPCVCTMCFQRK